MKKEAIYLVISAALLLAGCQQQQPATEQQKPAAEQPSAKAAQPTINMINAKGEPVGTATMEPLAKGVAFRLDVRGLPAGEHAIHVHESARCETPDFQSAGGHYNPQKTSHGLQHPEGPHAGDMENIRIGDDGTFKGVVENARVSLEGEQPPSVFANGGTALVIHAKPDDHKSQPAGAAGDRIACGEIRKQ